MVDASVANEVQDAAALVTVRYFAAAAEAAGREEETIAVRVGAPLDELRGILISRYGSAMARVLANGSFLSDGVVTRDFDAPRGTRVDVLPPFAGG